MGTRVKKGKLKPEVKAAWVEALRSGKYKQGRGVLFNTEEQSYCCLGVNCALLDQPYLNTGPQTTIPKSLPNKWDAETWWQDAPNLDMVDSPQVKYQGKWKRLTELNDDVGLTFEQIADLIGAQL
ncbi:hypothetical protein UFOVP810_25 [uncultured Caudovirales phage]|uniref:Uncharacterized protein n=1 Tax=uncultured Caudovirales phage TaxID=2100421 RepID=A0A6J5NWT7_9CAUD|nr:hypothetical protein UFOVP810_25 [uncultured Caudovirales phage]